MQQIQHETQIQQDEIDLIDIMRILWKRRKLIVFGTLLLTIFAAVVSLLLPKVYEVSTIFEPGKNGDESYVMPPEMLKESILGEAYDYRIRQELNIPFDEYPKVKVMIPKGTPILKVSIETKKPEVALNILNNMVKHINDETIQRLDFEKSNIENQIKATRIKNKAVEEKIELTQKQLDETNKKIKSLESNKLKALSTSVEGSMHVLLYSNEIQNQQIYINNLQEKLKNIEEEARGADIRIDSLQLQLSRLTGMKFLKPVTVSEKPVKPKKILIVTLTFISSLLAMTVISIVLHYIENRNAISETQG